MSVAEMWKSGHKSHLTDQHARVSSALKCLKLIKPFTPMSTVIDFGCGIGAWLHAARMLGATDTVGVEGAWISDAETLIDKSSIHIADLATSTQDFQKQFDLAMSIEVAEHLPAEAADGFVKSLTQASDHVLFSAAIPRQGGLGHINEQPLPYWVSKFWALGYVPIEPIRPYIATDRTVLPWLRLNLVMFVDYSRLITSAALIRHARPLSDFRLRYEILQ